MVNNFEFYLQKPTYSLFNLETRLDKDKIAILGIPLECSVSFRSGTKFSMKTLRYLSEYIEYTATIDLGLDPLIKACDLGDIYLTQDLEKDLERIYTCVKEVLRRSRKVIDIGGEHTLTLSTFKALTDVYGDHVVLIHVDAHLDARDEWPLGRKLSHATFMRRILENYNNISILNLGYRAYDIEEKTFLEARNAILIPTLTIEKCSDIELRQLIRDYLESHDGYVHLSIDIDVLDPSIAPGVSNPEAQGIDYPKLYSIVEAVLDYSSERLKVIDLVEYSPPNDVSNTTGILMLKLIIDILNLA